MRDSGDKEARRRYPRTRTSPWFFVVLTLMTLVFVLGGIFEFEPLIQLVSWLAVVL